MLDPDQYNRPIEPVIKKKLCNLCRNEFPEEQLLKRVEDLGIRRLVCPACSKLEESIHA